MDREEIDKGINRLLKDLESLIDRLAANIHTQIVTEEDVKVLCVLHRLLWLVSEQSQASNQPAFSDRDRGVDCH